MVSNFVRSCPCSLEVGSLTDAKDFKIEGRFCCRWRAVSLAPANSISHRVISI